LDELWSICLEIMEWNHYDGYSEYVQNYKVSRAIRDQQIRERLRLRKLKLKKTAAERYVNKVNNGFGSRAYKTWLTSKPMDAFVKRSG